MRSDRDKISDTEREIDDFLSQFDTLNEPSEPDLNSYLFDITTSNEKVGQERVISERKYVERPVSTPVSPSSSPKDLKDDSVFDSVIDSVIAQVNNEPVKAVPVHNEPITATPIYKEPATTSLYQSASVDAVQARKEHRFDPEENAARKAKGEAKAHRTKAKSKTKRQKPIVKSEKAAVVMNSAKERLSGVDLTALKQKFLYKENPNYDPGKGATYMLAGKKIKNTPYILSPKKMVLDFIGLCAAFCIIFLLYCSLSILFGPRYDFKDVYANVDQSSIIYDDDGKQVDQVYYDQNRKIIKYKDMPEDLVNSFVALEDKTFWKHHGFNWVRMVGAVVSSITGGGRISGTSTITQQLARNVYLADIKSVRSIKRKVLEMYYATRLEANLSKEEIVEAYLNTIYLGYGCYGVGSAAKAYYSKDVKDLDLFECTSLAALPQAPDTYALVQLVDPTSVSEGDPNIITREPNTYIANDTAKFRRNICLDFMKEQGYISEAEYNKVYDEDLIDHINPTFNTGNGDNSYFHEYLVDTVVADLMDEYHMDQADAERMIYTQGLKIYSTMDSTAQKTIVKEFNNPSNYPSIKMNKDSEGNIVSKDGVLLLYNYDNFFNDDDQFVFADGEAKVNSDGSVTIKKGHRLNIYTTTVNGETDYSLEFKQTYTTKNGVLYAIPGGYVTIPANYKSLDSNENLVISAQFFKDYPDHFSISDDKIAINKTGYSLPNKTIQPQSAMVVVGVGTGEVKAMVGGRSTKGERLLNRTLNPRQPGSSIKPLAVYGAALQKSFELEKSGKEWDYVDYGIDKQGDKGWGAYITTHSSVADEKCTVNKETWPHNSNRKFTGTNTFMTAIQQSINTCAFKIQLQVGTDYSVDMLEKFGLTTIVTDETQQANDLNPAALALGGMTKGVMPLEMALAYASFPGGGERNTPICYTKIVDTKGKTILTSKSEKFKVLDEGVAWIMTKVLQSVVTDGIAGSARVNNVQSGGKTGTTNDQYDIWFDGFTPTYAASLWIGTDNNIPLATLSGPAAALWGKIMRQIPKACTGKYKEQPANVISKGGCYFTVGTEKKLEKYTAVDEEKEKKKQYKAWLEERELHKTWVVDTPAVTTIVHHEATYKEIDELDADGNPTGNKITVIDKEAYDETVILVPEVGHWEYEEGWREGDFVYIPVDENGKPLRE